MLIILEGPDGAGKSTLACDLEKLILRQNPHDTVTLMHSGIPTMHPLDEYERSVTWYRPGEGNHLILDRHHWGEYVYPMVRNRPSQLDTPTFWHIENYLRRLGAIVVHVSAYADTYRRVFHERNDGKMWQLGELPRVELLYRGVRQISHLPVVDFNWESSVNGDLFRITDAAREHEGNCVKLNPFKTYVGPPTVNYLLLGDVRHGVDPETDQHNMDPAFVPFRGTSGHFLLNAVLGADLDQQPERYFNFGVANACDCDDPHQLWLVLGQPNVVVLGKNALREVYDHQKVGFHPQGIMPHPQYVRRFFHNDQYAYGQNIRMAARHGGDYSSWHAQLKAERDRTSTLRSSKRSGDTASVAALATGQS